MQVLTIFDGDDALGSARNKKTGLHMHTRYELWVASPCKPCAKR